MADIAIYCNDGPTLTSTDSSIAVDEVNDPGEFEWIVTEDEVEELRGYLD